MKKSQTEHVTCATRLPNINYQHTLLKLIWSFLFNLVSDYYLVIDYSHDEKLLEKYLL